MEVKSLERLFSALNEAEVRYLVVGGLAVVAYGYVRLTFDVDLVIDFDESNMLKALRVLEQLGYKPKIPVKLEQFAHREVRESWIRDKQMIVLSLFHPDPAATTVDIFVQSPFDFEKEYGLAVLRSIADSIQIPVVTIGTLRQMKQQAGRQKDLLDDEYLSWIERRQKEDPDD